MKRMLPRKLCVSPVWLAVVLLASTTRGDERRPINAVKKLFASTVSSTATTVAIEDRAVIKTPDRFAECPNGEFFDADGVCRDDWGRMMPITSTSSAAPPALASTVEARIGLQARCPEGQEYRDGRCQQRQSSTSRPGLQSRCPPGEAFDGQRCRQLGQSSTQRTPLQSRCAEGEAFDGQRCKQIGQSSTQRTPLQSRCAEGEAFDGQRCKQIGQSSTQRTPLQSRCAEGEAFDGQRCNAEVTPSTTTSRGRATTARKTRSRREDARPSSTTRATPRKKVTTPSKKASTRTKKPTPKAKTPRTKVSTSTTPRTQSAPSRKPRLNRATNATHCPRGQVEAKGLCVEVPKRRCGEGEVMRGGKCRLDASSTGTTPKGTTPFRKHRCARGEAFVAGRCQAGPTPTPTPPCVAGKELNDIRCEKQTPSKMSPSALPGKKLLVNLSNSQRRCPPGEAFDTEGNCRETWLEPFSE